MINILTSQYIYGIIAVYFYGVITMAFSYKPLWKLLIDKDMSKKALMSATGISKSTIDKMSRSEIVSLEIIGRLCDYFSCRIEDVIEYISKNDNN